MKARAIVLLLCLVLAAGGVVYAAQELHGQREAVSVTETTVTGDRSAAAGLVARQKARSGMALYWDLTIPLDDPAAATAAFSRPVPKGADEWTSPDSSAWFHIQSAALGGSGTYFVSGVAFDDLDDSDLGLTGLWPLLTAVYDRTPAGESRTETLRLRDYLTYYPFSVDLTLGLSSEDYGTAEPVQGYDNVSYYGTDGTEDVTQAINDYFRFPIAEDATLEVKLDKDGEGRIVEISCTPDDDHFSSLDPLSLELSDGLWFSFYRWDDGVLDYSEVPGGYGLYHLPVTLEQGRYGLTLTPRPDRLETVVSLPDGASAVDLRRSADGTALLLTWSFGMELHCTMVDRATGAVRQDLLLPFGAGEYGDWEDATASLRDLVEQDGLLLFTTNASFALCGQEADGTYRVLCHGALTDTIAEPGYLAWDGERLALAQLQGVTGLDLAVYDAAGVVQYVGQYRTSLNEGLRFQTDRLGTDEDFWAIDYNDTEKDLVALLYSYRGYSDAIGAVVRPCGQGGLALAWTS